MFLRFAKLLVNKCLNTRIAKLLVNKCLNKRSKKTDEPEQSMKFTNSTKPLSRLSSLPGTSSNQYQLTTLQGSAYDSQGVIDFFSQANYFSTKAHTLSTKWQKARKTRCIAISGQDLLDKKFKLEQYFERRPRLTRIYLAGHSWIGSDSLFSDSYSNSKKRTYYTEIARGLAHFIGPDINAEINVAACCAGAGYKPDHSDSFAARLQLEMYQITGKNYKVTGRDSLLYVTSPKRTMALDEFERIKNLPYSEMMNRATNTLDKNKIHKQQHSKFTYRMNLVTKKQERIDSYEASDREKNMQNDRVIDIVPTGSKAYYDLTGYFPF